MTSELEMHKQLIPHEETFPKSIKYNPAFAQEFESLQLFHTNAMHLESISILLPRYYSYCKAIKQHFEQKNNNS